MTKSLEGKLQLSIMEMRVKFLIVSLAIFGSSFCATIDSRKEIENERFLDIVLGISSVVNQLIDSVKHDLNNLVAQTSKWIQSEVREIETTLATGIIAFQQYIEQVYTELEVLIDEQIWPCLENIPEGIENVREQTLVAAENCQENGESKLSSIQLDVESYRESNQQSVEGMSAFIQACRNQANLGDQIKCAVDASRNISSSIGVLRENLANTTEIVSAKLESAVRETRECIATASRDGQANIQRLFEEARECLETATETSSQPTAFESTNEEGNSEMTFEPTTADEQ